MSSQSFNTLYKHTIGYLIKKYSIEQKTFHIMIINALLKKKSKGLYISLYREVRVLYCPIDQFKKYYRFNESSIRIKRIGKRDYNKFTPNYNSLSQRSILVKRASLQEQLRNKLMNVEYKKRNIYSNSKQRAPNEELMLNSAAYDSIYKISTEQNDSIMHAVFNEETNGEDKGENCNAISKIIFLISLCEKKSSCFTLRNSNKKSNHCSCYSNNNTITNSESNCKYNMIHSTVFFNNNNIIKDQKINKKLIPFSNGIKVSRSTIDKQLTDKVYLKKKKLNLKLFQPKGSVNKTKKTPVLKQALQAFNIKLRAKLTHCPITLSTVNSSSQLKYNYAKPKIIAMTSLVNSPHVSLLRLNHTKLNQIKQVKVLPLIDQCNTDPLRYLHFNQIETN